MKTSTLFLSSFLLLAACKDPAADKAKAVTGEAVATSSAATTAAGAVTLPFDSTNSKVNWTGSKVTGSHDGSFEKFTGSVKLVDNDPTKSTVNVDIETSSLKTTPDQLVTHLKSAELFDVEKFPKATFQSTEIKKGGEKGASHTVTGNLTLHGVTKSITFPATITTSADKADVSADFAINRKDFGINYPGKPNDLIRDNVEIKLDIHAKKS